MKRDLTGGHLVATTRRHFERLALESAEGLPWCASSHGVARGFCGHCGSRLFWRRESSDRISIMAGTVDGPIGRRLTRHIHVAAAGDDYAIDADLPAAVRGQPLPEIPATSHLERS